MWARLLVFATVASLAAGTAAAEQRTAWYQRSLDNAGMPEVPSGPTLANADIPEARAEWKVWLELRPIDHFSRPTFDLRSPTSDRQYDFENRDVAVLGAVEVVDGVSFALGASANGARLTEDLGVDYMARLLVLLNDETRLFLEYQSIVRTKEDALTTGPAERDEYGAIGVIGNLP